jgi:hypothetical protein
MHRGTAQGGVHAVLLGRACYGLLWHLAADQNLRPQLDWNKLGKRNSNLFAELPRSCFAMEKHKECRLGSLLPPRRRDNGRKKSRMDKLLPSL